MRTYAIGDIHGHLHLLVAVHRLIAEDRKTTGDATSPVVHVGDLVDRGADSRGVLDHLIRGIADGAPWVVLKGNHDRMFAGFVADPDFHDPGLRPDLSWLHPRLGGAATLASYGVINAADRRIAQVWGEARDAVPAAHIAFLDALPAMHRRGDCVLVHAGIRPGVALDLQTENDLLWIREPFLTDTRDHGPLIVHGHTVVDLPVNYGNRVNLDSGAAYGGPLSAVVIEGREVFHLTASGRVRLAPKP
jgi:serine/threonine protein phosphatase 1